MVSVKEKPKKFHFPQLKKKPKLKWVEEDSTRVSGSTPIFLGVPGFPLGFLVSFHFPKICNRTADGLSTLNCS